jgi:hypothetical protein
MKRNSSTRVNVLKTKKIVNISGTELFHQAMLTAPDSEITLQLCVFFIEEK